MINTAIKKLVTYAFEKGIANRRNKNFFINRILEILELPQYIEPPEEFSNIDLSETLKVLIDSVTERGIIGRRQSDIDCLKAKLIAVFMPLPSEVVDNFKKLYKIAPRKATQWLYKLSQDSNYVKKERITKNLSWMASTKYGKMEFYIDIAGENYKDASRRDSDYDDYPRCIFCGTNEGYAGRDNYPSEQNLRMIPITLNKEDWIFRYSPYGYFNEQCVAANAKHTPMLMDKDIFTKMFEFLNIFPHYFVGANSDLPEIGDDMSFHEHLIGGYYELPISRANVEKYYTIKRYEEVQTGIVNWPLPTIRLRHQNYTKIIPLAELILNKWKTYTDETVNIYDRTNAEQHNSITPIARKVGDLYEIDIVLRSNFATPEYPKGLFNVHKQFMNIKDTNLELFDVSGYGILPIRLMDELRAIAKCLLSGDDIKDNKLTFKHSAWIEKFIMDYDDISDDNIMEILQDEVGKEFVEMLENSAVFMHDENGQAAFERFINTLSA